MCFSKWDLQVTYFRIRKVESSICPCVPSKTANHGELLRGTPPEWSLLETNEHPPVPHNVHLIHRLKLISDFSFNGKAACRSQAKAYSLFALTRPLFLLVQSPTCSSDTEVGQTNLLQFISLRREWRRSWRLRWDLAQDRRVWPSGTGTGCPRGGYCTPRSQWPPAA